MILIASFLMGLAFAETFDIYVSPMLFDNQTTSGRISVNHDSEAPFYYTSKFARMAKAPNGHGGYTKLPNSYDKIRVYNVDNVEFFQENCDYVSTPLRCSVMNGNYYVETIVTLTDDQMIIRSTLYDPDGLIINSASRTDEMVVRWIKQQEVTIVETEGRNGKQTVTHYGKEDLPLKWEIPYRMFQKDVEQTMLSLWMGLRVE